MIRNATHNDLSAMLAIGRNTLSNSPSYPVEMDDKKSAYMIRRCISDHSMCAFVTEINGVVVGFILGVQEEHFFSRDSYATDLVFCVEPDYADQAVWLLRRFIRWAKTFPKVKSIMLGISSGMDPNGRLGELYQHHGLKPAGGLFVKVIGDGVQNMSGIKKAVKKVFKSVKKVVSKVWDVIKPIVKVVAIAAAIYFGGAALIALGSGGTAAGGLASAWTGVSGAGTAIAGGEFAAAGSSIAGGWSGAVGAGAVSAAAAAAPAAGSLAGATTAGTTTAAGTTATAAGTGAEIGGGVWGAGNGVAVADGAAGAAEVGSGIWGAGNGVAVSDAAGVAATSAAPAAATAAGMTAGEGLLYSAGIQAGTSLVGNMMQGKAAEDDAEEARKRMTYWGVDGEGNGGNINVGGLLNKIQLAPMSSVTPYGSQVNQPTTLDQLAKTVG